MSQIIATFAPASSALHLLSLGEVAEGGVLHIGIAFANALFLVALNLGNSKLSIKDIAGVDAAGRYIPSRWRAEGFSPPARFYGRTIYTNGAGVESVCSIEKVFLGPKVTGQAEARCPAFLFVVSSSHLLNPSVSGCLADDKRRRKRLYAF